MIYFGIVENINDPLKQGRVQVRVFGVHTHNKQDIPTESLPWSLVLAPSTTPGISGLGQSTFMVQGAWVVGAFTDKDFQDFLVFGSLPTKSSDTRGNTEIGFSDPSEVYPRELETEDNNFRARGEVEPEDNHIVGKYQPDSPYAPVYPFNHVYETESGHVKEYDDTPTRERIREIHKAGSFYEIGPDGSKVTRIVNDNYTLIASDDTLEVKGNVNIFVNGDVKAQVLGTTYLDCSHTTMTGDLRVDGDVRVGKDVNTDKGVSLNNHTHTSGVSDHTGTTSSIPNT